MIYILRNVDYTKPKTPVEDRLCTYCKIGIEDELYCILICPMYDDEHCTLFNVIVAQQETIITESVYETFYKIISSENTTILFKFLEICFKKRHIV